MGTAWSVRIAALPGRLAETIEPGIRAILERIVAQMSQWEPESDLSRFNRSPPGSWQRLPPEFVHVLAAALDVAARSGGAFDPAMGGLADRWGFGPSGPRASVPPVEPMSERRIELDSLLFSARRGVGAALDFSGIAKGYAVDAVAGYLHGLGL